MNRFLAVAAVFLAMFMFTPDARAHQYCENVQVGMSQPPLLGMHTDGVTPIYGNAEPIYQQRCVWKYGAVAINPATRQFWSAWNHDSAYSAETYVQPPCGSQCVWASFAEDVMYVALSDDDKFWGYSTSSADDARDKCRASGGTTCETVLAAGSGGEAKYWQYGAVAVGPNNATGASWNHYRRGDAEKAALQSCGHKDCWAFTFQGGYGAIARKTGTGELFGEWSAFDSPEINKRDNVQSKVISSCEKEFGAGSCEIVIMGAAVKP